MDELYARLAANPDDEAAWLVLADALTQAGNPMGELALVQHQLSGVLDDKTRSSLEEREHLLKAQIVSEVSSFDSRFFELDFYMGHLRGIACRGSDGYSLAMPNQNFIVRSLDGLLAQPCARLLRALSATDLPLADIVATVAWRDLVALDYLALAEPYPNLVEGGRRSSAPPIDLSVLANMGRLEALIVGHRSVGFATLPSTIKRLEYRACNEQTPHALRDASFTLHTLVVPEPREVDDVDALVDYLESDKAHALTYFGVINNTIDELPHRLLEAIARTRITTLEVWHADERLAEWIARSKPASLHTLVHWTSHAIGGIHREPRLPEKYWKRLSVLPQ